MKAAKETGMAGEKTATISWRDENYGRIRDAFAFRVQLDPHPSDTEHRRIAAIFRKSGFESHPQRAAWIAEYAMGDQPDLPVGLVESLQDAGYAVRNSGAVPEVLAQPSTAPVL